MQFCGRSRVPCPCRPESHKRNTCEPASVSCSPCRSILPCRQVRRETNIYVLSFCESSLSFFCILSNSSIAVLLAEIKMLQKLYCLQYYNLTTKKERGYHDAKNKRQQKPSKNQYHQRLRIPDCGEAGHYNGQKQITT